ncbi:efflux RND transporter periplasmic adaptor subunit [Chitinophaga silvatica]|uniref:Efflux RND transporter periplasmic adaptor subunit n=1 Tax=Chitinophaga silvatica TaxID=2282649 RepID=A0A3E1Y488_9BACT|nr:efflux RND transporter periplasmic adaptor subunit [Chitinophaga silvatica]RFS19456.1 efflux RND transporter periplasmic adaptor subunit [Chitinophaga silvatica]
MRNSYIVKVILGLSVILLGFASCKNKTDKASHAAHKDHQYTCPMHPQVISDKPGMCPICGMDLVSKETNNELLIDSGIARLTRPVNARVIASIPAISAEVGTRIYSSTVNGIINYDTRNQTSVASRVGGRIERLYIKYNYQPVQKGQLIMEVYSPDLAAAQRELLYVAKNGSELLAAAKQRLQLLGMQPAQIDQVIRTGNILYRIPVYSNSDGYILEKSAASQASPSPSSTLSSTAGGDGMASMSGGTTTSAITPTPATPSATPVMLREGQYVSAGQSLFTIYQAQSLVAEFAFPSQLAARIRQGQKILFFPGNDENSMQYGSIGLIEPVFRNGINFTLARVYLKDNHLQAGQLLTASIPVVYTAGWWLPKKAVGRLGNKSIVFKKENEVYVPIVVETGVEAKDMIQVNTDISGWKVASNAYYLVDSESFIKPNN